jgi:glutathione S-transferase
MLKLHGIPLSNCYNIVKQAMLEKGIPFQEISQPPSQDEAFLAISPMGKIPCIETPGGYLAESLAIIEYLEETHPVPKLYPAGTFDRARAREIIKIAELYLDAPARRLLGHVLFGAPLPQAAYDEARPLVERGLAALKRVARYEPWVAGPEFSYADIALLHFLRLTLMIMDTVYQWNPLGDEPELAAWLARASAREQSQTVLTAQQESLAALRASKG